MIHVLGGVNPNDARVATRIHWKRHLKKVFPDLESHFEILEDTESALQKIQSGYLHGLSLEISQFFKIKEVVNLTPVFISSRVNTPEESYLLITREDLDWNTLSERAVKTLITEKMEDPTIGSMWLETVLAERGLPPAAVYFSSITSAVKPSRIILPVFFGKAEACLIPESAFETMAELNPQLKKKLKVLAKSAGVIKTIHCATDQMPDHMVKRFIEKGVRMDDSIDGRQLLLIFHVKKNFVFKPEYLTNSEDIYKQYRKISTAKK